MFEWNYLKSDRIVKSKYQNNMYRPKIRINKPRKPFLHYINIGKNQITTTISPLLLLAIVATEYNTK